MCRTGASCGRGGGDATAAGLRSSLESAQSANQQLEREEERTARTHPRSRIWQPSQAPQLRARREEDASPFVERLELLPRRDRRKVTFSSGVAERREGGVELDEVGLVRHIVPAGARTVELVEVVEEEEEVGVAARGRLGRGVREDEELVAGRLQRARASGPARSLQHLELVK